MIKTRKWLALILAGVMALGLAGCGGAGKSDATPKAEEKTEEAAEATEEAAKPETEEKTEEAPKKDEKTPLVVGYDPFNEKFSPFFSETAYDQDVWAMTQVSVVDLDRLGEIVYKGIEGETRAYNGTDYTYTGVADVNVTENDDGTVFYDIKLRDDVKFSDGKPLTIDDLIFSIYVVCDPTYDGSLTLSSMPIEGLEAYKSNMSSLAALLEAAGPANTDFTYWTEEQQTKFWEKANAAALAIANEVVAKCVSDGTVKEGDIVGAAAAWNFTLPEGSTVEQFAATMMEAYKNDINSLVTKENAGSTMADLFPDYSEYAAGVATGESAPNISGVQKVDDYNLRVVATKVDANMIYQLALPIAPMHYYGDASLYDYANNKFGFPKGNLESVRAKTTKPMGAGPYKFIKYENGVVNFERNDDYYKGKPVTQYINFRVVADADKTNGVIAGDLDITDPSYSKDRVKEISTANNGEVTGDVITTSTVDNLGYGYIGINTINVAVGNEPGSDASKNLRRAFATIFAVYRDVAIDSYYGDAAEVINYPISNTSWAAPRATDEGYQLAFSVDVNGDPIYTSDMSADDKYAAAKKAALGFFEAAGYTVDGGKVTAAPEGAKMEYEVMVPADGKGDHPAFMILTLAKEALKELGINLIINDLTQSNELWTKLEAIQGEMWCAAWGATVDPDMTQVYFSDTAHAGTAKSGQNPLGGGEQGGSNYMYCIADKELDEMIVEARASTDQAYRKEMYKACLDKVINWACEIPTYQRQNAIIFSTKRVNTATITPDITTYYNWNREIEKIALN